MEESDEIWERWRCEVDKGQGKERIDKYLAEHMTNTSRNRIQTAADAGNVWVNGKPVASNYRVKPGEIIQVLLDHEPHDFTITPENIPLDIVYEDDDLLVVNKPAGLVVHPGHGNYEHTLLHALAWHFEEELKKFLSEVDPQIKVIEVPYDNATYMKDLEPLKDIPEGGERCFKCYRKRLAFGYDYAEAYGYDYFGTVMSISRYKNSQELNKIGYELESTHSHTKWLPADFKKEGGYEKSLKIVREHEMYFQEYCGCVYSYNEYLKRKK